MQVAKIIDNTIDEVGELKTLFPNSLFPKTGPNDAWYTENNVMPVSVGLPFDPAKQKMENVDPYIDDGVVYTVRVVDLTAEEQTAYANEQTANLAAAQRRERDRLLSLSDWMVIKAAESGEELNAEWKVYRQALRDITSHSNFPNLSVPDPAGEGDNDWPVEPSS